MGDNVIGETEYGLDLVEYNNIYQYDQNPRPDFGMGKCFFVEPLPYFGTIASYERALSQNNMTHVHGEVNWEYTYNEIGLPTMINVIWPGVELSHKYHYKASKWLTLGVYNNSSFMVDMVLYADSKWRFDPTLERVCKENINDSGRIEL